MPALSLGVLADVGREECQELLGEVLARRGSVVVESLSHRDLPEPELSTRLRAHPGCHALTLHEAIPDAIAPPSTIIHASASPRWDPQLVRELSALSGGWGLALHLQRTRERYGSGQFFSGRTLELGQPAAADEDELWQAFVRDYDLIAGGNESQLRWSPVAHAVSLIVRDPAHEVLPAPESPLDLAVLLNVTEERARSALASVPIRVSVAERSSPIASIPYVLLEGEFRLADILLLARDLACDAAAAKLHSPGRLAQWDWLRVHRDGELNDGAGQGGEAFARFWAELAITIGEPPAIFRWPREVSKR